MAFPVRIELVADGPCEGPAPPPLPVRRATASRAASGLVAAAVTAVDTALAAGPDADLVEIGAVLAQLP